MPQKVIKLSASTLKTFRECPRCFWLNENTSYKRPHDIMGSLPFGMDRILKQHFDDFRHQGKLPPELKREGISTKLFPDQYLVNLWRDARRGLVWRDKQQNILKGALDDVLEWEDKLVVVDFKTRGFPPKDDTASYYQDQLNIYNFLLRENKQKTLDYAYLLFYYPNRVGRNGILFNTKAVQVQTNADDAKKLFEEAVQLLMLPMPQPAKDCQYCSYHYGRKSYEKP